MLALDFGLILLLSAVSGAVYHFAILDEIGKSHPVLRFGVLVGALFVGTLQARGRYKPSSILLVSRQAQQVALTWTFVFALLLGVGFVMKISDWFSRGFVLSFFFTGLVTFPLWRIVAAHYLGLAIRSGLLHGERVVLIGEADQLSDDELLEHLRVSGYEIRQTVPLPFCSRFEAELRRFAPRLVKTVRDEKLGQVLIAASWAHLQKTEDIARALHVVPIPVRLLPDRQVRRVLRHQHRRSSLEDGLELKRSPLTLAEQAAKRCVDLVVAATTILLLVPLFLVAAITIRLDSRGPVLFRQQRVGFSGRPFRIYKFRTMTAMEDGSVVKQATADDIRVTRVGRWLRRTSIDELPQLLNVITGDMSLVGPRPHAMAHDSTYDAQIGNYALRHHVKPGITGCAQVSGFRGETATLEMMKGRVERDLWYIDNWSLALDLKVMIATIREVVRTRNAY